jgi:hypothetical protein
LARSQNVRKFQVSKDAAKPFGLTSPQGKPDWNFQRRLRFLLTPVLPGERGSVFFRDKSIFLSPERDGTHDSMEIGNAQYFEIGFIVTDYDFFCLANAFLPKRPGPGH